MFFDRLNQISALIPGLSEHGKFKPSALNNLVAIIKKDKNIDLYFNETNILLVAQGKESIKIWQPVSVDQIANIRSLKLDKIPKIKDSEGVVVILTCGWRKLLLWDFIPFGDGKQQREYDIELSLLDGYNRLLFPEICQLNKPHKYSGDWFPFIGLSSCLRDRIASPLGTFIDNDILTSDVHKYYSPILDARMCEWGTVDQIKKQMEFIKSAKRSYDAADYVASISTLLPRIEGILREFQQNTNWRIGSGELAKEIIPKNLTGNVFTPLLPIEFTSFIDSVIFKRFDGTEFLTNRQLPELGRHSLAHGIAPSDQYDQASALKIFLIIDQIYYISKSAVNPGIS